MALNFHGNGIYSKFEKSVFIHTMSTSDNSSVTKNSTLFYCIQLEANTNMAKNFGSN